MKLYLFICFMAVAILAAQGYRSEDFNAWYEEALERDMEDQAKLQNHEDKGNSSQVGPPPTGNPHGCDCKGECKELRHGQVPFKERDYHNYLNYENFPVLCRDAAALMLTPGEPKPKKKYICKQTFDCCRKCNNLFYVCLKESKKPYGFCMRGAYKCMCNCIEHKSYNELPYKR